ncbi:cytochrome b [Candidatus Lariskella endosymbiont of Epinotia ramella]|uniref:cytochrome b n=1 Tax=Candidatus Lariskella endosymbiont of Epinotia ramella TaxID=3066224 RepID=UPI0030CB0EF7
MSEHYNYAMRCAHWLYAMVVICTLSIGFYMVDLPNEAKPQMYALHKSFGVLSFFLLVLRIIIRRFSYIPELPDSISQFERISAKIGVFILYILMLIMPMSGYVMSVAGGRDVYFFSFELPKLLPINSQLSAISYLVHVNVCYILAAAIVLHILFAIKHLIFDKVNLFARIWRVESAN